MKLIHCLLLKGLPLFANEVNRLCLLSNRPRAPQDLVSTLMRQIHRKEGVVMTSQLIAKRPSRRRYTDTSIAKCNRLTLEKLWSGPFRIKKPLLQPV